MDWVVAALFLLGSGFMGIAALGVWRLPDVYARMHAASKSTVLGAGLLLGSLALHFGETWVVVEALAVLTFLVVTAPVAAHVIGRAAYRLGVPLWRGGVVDDLREQAGERDADI
jgi:multicomponent Na+:H+ antiporter subunit G